jgi:hypothetical protein
MRINCVKGVGFVLVVTSLGCSESKSRPSNDTTVAIQAISSSVSSIEIAYTSSEYANQLPSIVASTPPKNFHWVSFGFPVGASDALHSAQGLQIDLTDKSTTVTFSQVYPGPCNPAKNDFSDCWLYESYAAGDSGLTGSLAVTVHGAAASGGFNVTWEGITDRFGDPPQQHQHSTEGGFVAAIVANVGTP